MTHGIRLGLLISGSGSTMEAIIKQCRPTGRLPGITPACVIASTPEAGGIAKARGLIDDWHVAVIERREYVSPEAFGEAIIQFCRKRRVDWLGQYGWMRRTPKNVIAAFDGRMINQHPGPVRPPGPGFGGKGMFGKRVHCARLLFVQRTNRHWWTEATAQRVHPEYDEGEVLKVGRAQVLQDDTVDELQQRLLPVEHETQIRLLEDIMHGRLAPVADLPPLVLPGEEALLEECKAEAIRRYPHG